MKSYGNLNICTCGKEISYIKTRKPNGRMGVIIIHADEIVPADATIPNVSDEYKNWLKERMHTENTISETKPTVLPTSIVKKEIHHIDAKPKNIVSAQSGKFSIVSDVLKSQHDTIDDAMNAFLQKVPNAAFSFWNENQNSSWLDIYSSHEDTTIIGKIYEGGN